MIYLEFLDREVELGIENDGTSKFTDGARLVCHLHGDLKYYSYDALIPADVIIRDIEEHRRVMHFD